MNRTDFLARLRQALQGLPSRSTILSPITTRISARRWLHKIGLIYGFQNAAMLGNDASRVEIAQWPAHLPGCRAHLETTVARYSRVGSPISKPTH